jgi:hypothetical protein
MTLKNGTAAYLMLASVLVLGSVQAMAQDLNTKFGTGALWQVTSGVDNSAFGLSALYSNTTGSSNTASGTFSLVSNTSGNDNTANGFGSLWQNTSGSSNTASGTSALYNNRTGSFNTAIGAYSHYNNSTGGSNTASGAYALFWNSSGSNNTAVGVSSLERSTTGGNNTAVGATSMYKNTSGRWNNAVGAKSLYSITTGEGNAAQGFATLYNNTTGSNNLAIGNTAGYNNKTGSGNVFLGWNAGFAEMGSNTLYITNNQQTPLIYGQFHSTPSENKLGIGTKSIAAGDTLAVWNGARLTKGGVWTNASSRELKDNIETLSAEDANAALEDLSPVRYVYRNSREEEYVGFIAEDVPELVASNDHKSLSPMDIVAVLTTVTKGQKEEIDTLRSALAQQELTMQKQEERLLQMEMALAEVLRKQSSEDQFGSID